MSLHRTAAKRDGNEGAIVAALREAGATVEMLSVTNAPDLLVGFRGINYLIEVKMPKKKLKRGQHDWFWAWRGQCAIAWSVDDALRIIGAIGEREDI
jgi:hypothetical protein